MNVVKLPSGNLLARCKACIDYDADAVCRECRLFVPASSQAPQPDDWQHLKAYGYAPGGYMSLCHKCGDTPAMDKRACTCRPCAEKMHAAALAVQAPEGGQLPPLPEPLVRASTLVPSRRGAHGALYTADQMCDYARAALAAQQEPVFHLRSYGDVSAGDLKAYADRAAQPLTASQMYEEGRDAATQERAVSQAPAEGAQVAWTDAAVLSLLRNEGDGPFGEDDIATTRRFMERAEVIRAELIGAQPQPNSPESGGIGSCTCVRAAFEAWDEPGYLSDGETYNATTLKAWRGFQAGAAWAASIQAPAVGEQPQEVQHAAWRNWADAGAVGSLIAFLATLDQAAPIVTAYHVTMGSGERRCKTHSLTISRERVDHATKTIRTADTSLPYTHVLWAHPPEHRPLPEDHKRALVVGWFAEDWAIEKALGMLGDYDHLLFKPPVQGKE